MSQTATRRGLPYAEAMAYVGVKRRQFDEKWRPRLVAIPQGVSLIFDVQDLDRLFEEFKAAAAGVVTDAANEGGQMPHNGPWNGRPAQKKGSKPWAKTHGESSPTKTVGRLTNGSGKSAFDSAVSEVLQKQKVG